MAITDPILFIQGALTLTFTGISLILGILLILKYLKYKEKQLLLVGITWIFLTSPWWPDSISFVMMLVGDETTYLPNAPYFFLANALIFPIFITWPRTFGNLVLEEKPKAKNAIIWILAIWAVFFEIIFFIMFFNDYTQIGERKGAYLAEWNPLVAAYITSGAILFTITGLLFSFKAIKSETQMIRAKGKILALAFVVFTVWTLLEVLFVEIPVMILAARICGIISALAFYVGFVLPKFVKNLFKL